MFVVLIGSFRNWEIKHDYDDLVLLVVHVSSIICNNDNVVCIN